MICCDQCEEWYHGDCVGISVGQGKRMEREGKDYVCPVCIARMKDAKEEREINRYEKQFSAFVIGAMSFLNSTPGQRGRLVVKRHERKR
jgi:hypothetical protein